MQSVGDLVFGYNPAVMDDPSTPDVDESRPESTDGTSLFEGLFGFLGVLFPWLAGAGGVGGSLRWFYIEARKRKLDDLFKAVVIGIKDAVDSAKDGTLDKETLYESIKGARDLYANRAIFDKLVDDIKKAYDAEHAAEEPPADQTAPPVI
jgi:hypothetical protein